MRTYYYTRDYRSDQILVASSPEALVRQLGSGSDYSTIRAASIDEARAKLEMMSQRASYEACDAISGGASPDDFGDDPLVAGWALR